MHQPASGIVDIDEQRTLRTAVLEPPMLGAVNLHQLTQTITPRSRLMDALQPVLSANPKAGLDHPLPQRLDAEIEAVNLGQLLGGQGRTKIGIALAHDSQDRLAEHCTQSAVAPTAAFPRNQTVRTISTEGLQQSVDLSASDANKPGGVCHRQASIDDVDQHPQTRQLLAAHRHHRHAAPPRQASRQPSSVTSRSVRPRTVLSVIYRSWRRKREIAPDVQSRDDPPG